MRFIDKRKFFALFMLLILSFTLLISYAKATGSDIADSVLRLHIIANSDNTADQNLKLAVRDRILRETKEIFENSKSASDAARLAEENTAFIKEIAEAEILAQGFNYPVSVTIEETAFPTRVYADIALPSGRYNAVRVKIGDAKGQNWWCVMYPPLCFTDGILCASDKSKSQLATSLSADEYALITGKDCGAIPVEVRFKIVEIFQNLF
ncbi:MAG: stage II sporulation protein R [Clostridia bacterium]|nr:stage II sporulation protein R [Clostridia bacterium]